jgi:hypothetical protein
VRGRLGSGIVRGDWGRVFGNGSAFNSGRGGPRSASLAANEIDLLTLLS